MTTSSHDKTALLARSRRCPRAGRGERAPGRAARARLHVLPSRRLPPTSRSRSRCARSAGCDARDRRGVPRAGAAMAQRLVRAKRKIRTPDPVSRSGRRDRSRIALPPSARPLSHLQRRLRRQRAARARPARPLRGGDPAREAALRADARRARGFRPAGADAPAGLARRRALSPPVTVLLADQDRTLWDARAIDEGLRMLARAERRGAPAPTSSRRRSPPAMPRDPTRQRLPRPTRPCCGSMARLSPGSTTRSPSLSPATSSED